MEKNIVCAIYYHPEAYPPTLNAIHELSGIYNKVYIIYQPHLKDLWEYPPNVFLLRNGKKITVEQQSQLSPSGKASLFFSFTYRFLKLCIKVKPEVILVYDAFPLLSYHLSRKAMKFKHKIWYHNHDVVEHVQKKYSIGWWAAKTEKKSFQYLNLFSLPSNERKIFFDLRAFKGMYFHIPNYPSLQFYKKIRKSIAPVNSLIIIYQGSISAGHGIEELMNYMNIKGKNIRLILIGNIRNHYKKIIQTLAKDLNIKDFVDILDPVNYIQLPNVTNGAHIGLAIHKPHNIIYATGGTASNKIYEYAALGLPVLFHDSKHYNQYLSQYKWAFANDLSMEKFDEQLSYIQSNYNDLSSSALNDFHRELNFEKGFQPVKSFLQSGSYSNS